MLRGPERVQSMAQTPRGEHCGHVWVKNIHLPQSLCAVQTCRIVWEKSRIGVRIEVVRHPVFHFGPNDWRVLDLEVGDLCYTLHTESTTDHL